jgi:hypothetical protein
VSTRARRLGQRLAVLAAAAGLTAALAQTTTTAAFTAQTDNGNTAATATTFCTSTGQTVYADADSTGYEQNATTKYGSNVSTGVISLSGGDARVVLDFTLPSVPQHCAITGATLRLWVTSVSPTARTVEAYRVTPGSTWTEAGVDWNSLPTTVVETPATSTSLSAPLAWQEWVVTDLVKAMNPATERGFLLKDSDENAGTMQRQVYDSDEGTNKPQLVVTWG